MYSLEDTIVFNRDTNPAICTIFTKSGKVAYDEQRRFQLCAKVVF